MRVAIAGGGLQGVELCWLAKKAGWETLLVDRRPAPPALHLADGFVQADVTRLEAEGREAAERMALSLIHIWKASFPPMAGRAFAFGKRRLLYQRGVDRMDRRGSKPL